MRGVIATPDLRLHRSTNDSSGSIPTNDHLLPLEPREHLLVDVEHGDGIGYDAEEVRAETTVQRSPAFFPQDKLEGLEEGGVSGWRVRGCGLT